MARIMYMVIVYLYVLLHNVSSEEMSLDPRFDHCLWSNNYVKTSYEVYFRKQISEEYAKLQIVTGLTRYSLSSFGSQKLTPTDNISYANFLVCSWSTFGYIKNDEIIYDSIEMALKEAFTREVGGTGPGANLSKWHSRNIMNNCKTNPWMSLAQMVVNLQNCIHNQIKYLKVLDS